MSGIRTPRGILETISEDLGLLNGYAETYQWTKEIKEKIWELNIKKAQLERLLKIVRKEPQGKAGDG